MRRVSFWDDCEKVRVLTLEEAEERVKARADFKSWALMEEISWRQKSRETWLKDGDRNTRFFHRMANTHRRRNCLNSICINGRKLDKEADIKEGPVDAFQNLLSAPAGWSPSLPDLDLNRIGIEEVVSLEETFSENEIWTTISGLNSDKAPGSDGFPLAFWSFSWDFVKDEVIGFFKEFHDNSRFVKNLNTTFLVLIPLLAQLNEHAKLLMLRNATWTLSNFCRGKPQPPFDQVVALIIGMFRIRALLFLSPSFPKFYFLVIHSSSKTF